MTASATPTHSANAKVRKLFVVPEVVQHKALTDGTLMLVTNVGYSTDPTRREGTN